MRQLVCTVIAIAAGLIAGGPVTDLVAAPARPRTIPVIITFADLPSDKIQSDSGQPYQDRVNDVNAYIDASNNGALIFGSGRSRTIQFVFDDCLSAPADCNAPWPSLNEQSGFLTNVLRGGVVPNGGLTAMTVNEELAAWAKINIPLDSDPAFWNVCFDSRKVVGPCGIASGGTSSDARIRRDAPGQWTIWATSTERADLIRDSDTRKNRTFTVMGTYSMPFSFTVQCVNSADCP